MKVSARTVPSLVLFFLLTSAAPAFAECAWVLWRIETKPATRGWLYYQLWGRDVRIERLVPFERLADCVQDARRRAEHTLTMAKATAVIRGIRLTESVVSTWPEKIESPGGTHVTGWSAHYTFPPRTEMTGNMARGQE